MAQALKEAKKETTKAIAAPKKDAVAKQKTAVYSTPCTALDKQFLMNESKRTGRTQKELVEKAIIMFKAGPKLPNALPIEVAKTKAQVEA